MTATDAAPASRDTWIGAAAYHGMIAAAVGLVFLVRLAGEGLTAPPTPPDAPEVASLQPGQVHVVRHVFATLAAVIGLGYVLGRVFVAVGQPPVIGEVIAGIALGPSLLGAISPDAMHFLIPGPEADPRGQVSSSLRAIAQVGVALYMFLVGLELNGGRLKSHARAAVAISHASIVAPFVLGVVLALWLYPNLSHAGVPFTSFALFLGAAMAVTAFPVLARILADRKLDKTDIGVVALGCAAADDVTAWCLLALVAGVAQSQVNVAVAVTLGAAAYIAFMFVIVRPGVEWLARTVDATPGPLPSWVFPGVLAAVLASALATEMIGIHAVFGAFLLGAVVPHESRIAREMTARLAAVVTVVLLPAFFAVTGLRTQVGLLSSGMDWVFCAAVIAVATVGKVGGTLAAARLTGYDWRTAAALGAMMNTRGLMGLIVLDLGLGMGVITPTLYAMMVLMALATTIATAPAVDGLLGRSPIVDRSPVDG
ncbi:MAG: cation:proton antiporter [Fimbriiglobus sp.]